MITIFLGGKLGVFFFCGGGGGSFYSSNTLDRTLISCCYSVLEQLPQPADTTTPSAVNKPKVSRTQFSIFQKVALEYSFHTCLYLTGEERDALASKLGLSPVIVQVSI